ncbi:hypothetical protein QVH35_11690 [Candidatus Nitrosotenuis chungbukensis]|uniref:hypothetical protein n=1 Tax=Candidatus Nitrosotenuis chungbukensis TaxID=1353246 RepID=UPI0005B2A55C|nr:hypothetical protein [Candidatus Nitrosotenuis chungbukensis]WKT57928.1 hypothetical protein QVH35_11690 [Candidatus Nitrosotenuis chungbukensis]
MDITWQYFPKSAAMPKHLQGVIDVFVKNEQHVGSQTMTLVSNKVLSFLREGLTELGYEVEASAKRENIVRIPVLFGKNGKMDKSFNADAYNGETKTVIEVEAGRAVANNQFLKDLFEACMMNATDYLVIAVRKVYRGKKDFEAVNLFFDVLYASRKLELPLKGILIIGY